MAAVARGFAAFILLGVLAGCNDESRAQRMLGVQPGESGGPLTAEQAAYNVHHYEIDLAVRPERREIEGTVAIHAHAVHALDWFVADLDTTFLVHHVIVNRGGIADTAAFSHTDDGRVYAFLGGTAQPGEPFRVDIAYAGAPREAPRPPWVGGFIWSETEAGEPWIGVACQADGADIWWPVKDHPSDRADSVLLRISVPEGLTVAANGRLRDVRHAPEGISTFEWFTSTPINNYAVSINIAPYELIEREYESITGERFPFNFWVLPERLADAERMLPQFKEHMRFFEELFGPYPFRADKYGIAHVPYLGMEHQTIIAYGSDFSNNEFGFDWLHHHELAHEWWGNLVTVLDWRDFWIHEGFATYAQNLYAERLGGAGAYRQSMLQIRPRITNLKPLAPRESMSTRQMYFVAPEYVQSDTDMYFKGAWILHSLRYLMGDEPFFTALRRMAYPTEEMERATDGSQSRFATTDEIQHIAEAHAGRDLSWFFEVYLRQSELPVLASSRDGNTLTLRWDVPGGVPFEMPIDVRVGTETRRVEMTGGRGSIDLAPDAEIAIDPHEWVLRAE